MFQMRAPAFFWIWATTMLISKDYLAQMKQRIQDLYLADEIPWVIGYSGGKDSTATLQLVWTSLQELPEEQRMHKRVYVISTDTKVEQPIVAAWVKKSLEKMNQASKEQNMPIQAHRLMPKISDTFWVNLIGRRYSAPRSSKTRWCTNRLKIKPSNQFILDVVKSHGQAILVLGTRKAESATRKANMEKYEKQRVREWLSPNGSLPNSLVFSPIEDWTSDDVWTYLLQFKNPWGIQNVDLMVMYREASEDSECPIVIDNSSSPNSCGNSRFGCWVCTIVSEDKSLKAMVQNDEEKEWMQPFLDFRNEFAPRDARGNIVDQQYRDYRRFDGTIKLYDKTQMPIHGPYTKERSEYLLRRLLEVQVEIQDAAREYLGEDLELITLDEIHEIRRIWVEEKHEFCDSVPRIYEEVMGHPLPGMKDYENVLGRLEWELLEEMTGGNYVELELMSSLLDIEAKSSRLDNRKSIVEALESRIKRCFYESEEDAAEYQRQLNAYQNPTFEREIEEQQEEDEQVVPSSDQKDDELPAQLSLLLF